MESGDKLITCIEKGCGREFVFTKGEQEFFEKKGFPTPKRCPDCRKVARKRYNDAHGTGLDRTREGAADER